MINDASRNGLTRAIKRLFARLDDDGKADLRMQITRKLTERCINSVGEVEQGERAAFYASLKVKPASQALGMVVPGALRIVDIDTVVCFTLSKDKKSVQIEEQCDLYYRKHFDKQAMTNFIEQLTELRDHML